MNLTKAIITAMPDEAKLIIEKYSLEKEKSLGALDIYRGERDGDEGKENIVLALCGVGKIHSAFAMTYLLENYDLHKIVNIGIVGNINHALLKIGDVCIPNTFVQHDVYIPDSIDDLKYLREPIFTQYAVGEEYDLQKFSLHLSGICATGDQFIDNPDLASEIHEQHGADIVDMEAYSILSVIKNYDMLDKVVVIKSVSDGADREATDDHVSNLDLAMENAVAILDFVL